MNCRGRQIYSESYILFHIQDPRDLLNMHGNVLIRHLLSFIPESYCLVTIRSFIYLVHKEYMYKKITFKLSLLKFCTFPAFVTVVSNFFVLLFEIIVRTYFEYFLLDKKLETVQVLYQDDQIEYNRLFLLTFYKLIMLISPFERKAYFYTFFYLF